LLTAPLAESESLTGDASEYALNKASSTGVEAPQIVVVYQNVRERNEGKNRGSDADRSIELLACTLCVAK